MRYETFKPLVLVTNKKNGAAVMFARRFWDSRPDTKYETCLVVAFADTPKEAAQLWEMKDKINGARNARKEH